MSAKLCLTLDSTQTQTQTLFLWTCSCVSPSSHSTFFFSFVGSVAARLPHPLWFSFVELLILECYIAVPQLSATGGNAVLAKNMFVNITPHSNCRCECTTGQELTARGAPKLVVTVNITEPVEKRLSLALEHRIWSVGDTGGGAWARAKLAGATDHGARGQLWNEACTHGSLTLPRNTRYKQHSAAEVPNAKRLSTAQVMPQRCTMTRARPTWRLAFQHLTPGAVCLGRSV